MRIIVLSKTDIVEIEQQQPPPRRGNNMQSQSGNPKFIIIMIPDNS